VGEQLAVEQYWGIDLQEGSRSGAARALAPEVYDECLARPDDEMHLCLQNLYREGGDCPDECLCGDWSWEGDY
jgi:hypothetical protein